MKKSKLVIALILSATALVSLFAFGACNSEDAPIQVHEHTFAEQAESQYMLSAATCTSSAVYCKSCSECGERSEETFSYGAYADHSYEWYPVIEAVTTCTGHKEVHLCTVCKTQDPFNGEKVEPPHSDEWTVETEPTEESIGKLVGTCKNCELPAEIVLPRLNDKDYDTSGSITASCDVPGVKKYVYAADNDRFEFTVTSTVMHVLNKKTIELGSDVKLVDDYLGDYTLDDLVSGRVDNIGFFNGDKITCKDEGVHGFFKCDSCNRTYTAYFKKSHDKFSERLQTVEQKERAVAPTCDSDGAKYYTCSGCEKEFVETVDKIGHAFEYKLEKGATDGTWQVLGVCKNKFNGVSCGETDNQDVSDSDVGTKQEPTCNKGAIRSYVYNGFELLYEESDTDVLHRYYDSASKVDKRIESSITGVGTHVYEISELPNIVMLGEPKNALCSNDGNEAVFTCADCGKHFIVLVKYPHSKPTDPSSITHTDATCVDDEKTQYTCTTCNEPVVIVGEPKLGHDVEVTIVTEPTAVAEGKVKVTCKHEGCSINDSADSEVVLPKFNGDSSENVKIESNSKTEFNKLTNCATRTVTTYTYYYKSVSSASSDAEWIKLKTYTVATEWTSGHPEDGAGETIIEVRINGVYYRGYICSACGKFIVIQEV